MMKIKKKKIVLSEKKKENDDNNNNNNNTSSTATNKKKSTALTGQRQQAVGIVLKKLKLTPDSFCEKLLECSEDLVDADVIDAVYRAMPLPDEVKNLKFESEKRDLIEWGDVEEALFAISQRVPDAKERLALVKSINDIPSLLETTERQFTSISQLVPQLVYDSSKSNSSSTTSSSSSSSSSSLAKVLRLILKVGNFLNKSTVHGNAVGFSLETLGTLTMMKSVDGTSTLMDAIVEMFYNSKSKKNNNNSASSSSSKIEQQHEKEDFADSLLKSLVEASTIPLSQLSLNVAELARTMQRTRKAASLSSNNSVENNNNNNNDKLHLVAKKAQDSFSTRIASLLMREQSVREEIILVIEYFGDAQNLLTSASSNNTNNSSSSSNINNTSIDEVTLFTCLRSFCREWIRCRSAFLEKQQRKKKEEEKQRQQKQNQNKESSSNNKTEEETDDDDEKKQKQQDGFQDHGSLLKKVQDKRKLEEEGDW